MQLKHILSLIALTALYMPAFGQITAADCFEEGIALYEQGNYNEAIRAYDEAIRLDPNLIEAIVYKGNVLAAQGKYDEAIETIDKAIKIDPADKMAWERKSKIWNQKGQDFAQTGKYKEAINAYDEAIKINLNDTIFWYNKGDAFEALGLYSEAKEAFEKGDSNINNPDCEHRFKNLIGHPNNAKYDFNFEDKGLDQNLFSGIYWEKVPELALWTLGEISDSDVVGPLIRVVNENESSLRYMAIEILGDIGDPGAVGPLILALKDNDSAVRAYSALALGNIGDLRAADALIQALKDNDDGVRWCAARALAGIENAEPEVMHALRMLASDDSSEEVRSRAKASLNELQFLNSCID